jgi:NADPH-dependent 2,4-dienoyl-CoA reductase/sulfur reductase-like enzyme
MNLPHEELQFLVIGAGPAGLCAAREGAMLGLEVSLIDENDRPGGQLAKQIHRFFGSEFHGAGKRGFEIAGELNEDCLRAGVDMRLSSTVLGYFTNGELMVDGPSGVYIAMPRAVVVATGASEKSFAFPGWTLPGVMGAGAAQTLINIHRVLPGKRVLMVGSGNVGLIVSYQLLQAGCEVAGIVDVANEVSGYEVHAERVRREGVPLYLGYRILAAEGETEVEGVIVQALEDARILRFDVDVLCLAVGLSPLAELISMHGCRMAYDGELGGILPWHDENMRTSQSNTYVAGDASGVEEASVAMEEGRLAAISAGEDLGLIDAGQAASGRGAIRLRLDELRAGPYGCGRLEAKGRLYAV